MLDRGTDANVKDSVSIKLSSLFLFSNIVCILFVSGLWLLCVSWSICHAQVAHCTMLCAIRSCSTWTRDADGYRDGRGCESTCIGQRHSPSPCLPKKSSRGGESADEKRGRRQRPGSGQHQSDFSQSCRSSVAFPFVLFLVFASSTCADTALIYTSSSLHDDMCHMAMLHTNSPCWWMLLWAACA